MRLHLISTLHGLPVGYTLTGVKADERATLLSKRDATPVPVPAGPLIMASKGYNGAWLEEELNHGGVELNPARPEKGKHSGQAGSFSSLCDNGSSRCLTR